MYYYSAAPTFLLIKPDGRTVDSFGYEAQERYSELFLDGCNGDWYYFTQFKMLLYDKTVSIYT